MALQENIDHIKTGNLQFRDLSDLKNIISKGIFVAELKHHLLKHKKARETVNLYVSILLIFFHQSIQFKSYIYEGPSRVKALYPTKDYHQ